MENEILSKNKKKISSKSKMKKKRAGVRIFKGFLIVFLLLIIIGMIGGGLFLKKILDKAPKISPASVKPSGYFTTVYNADGSQELEKFVTSGSNRIYKTINEIPEDLQDAFVAIEDERFTSITESTCKEFFVPVLSASQAVTFLKVPARLPSN